MKLRIGTRGSPLALAQANETKERLVAAHGLDPAAIEIKVITTTGDRIRDRPLNEIGGKGLFTKEIEEALFANDIDLAVHSMKDVAAIVPQGLAFAAILPREDVRDAFLSLAAPYLRALPQGARLGSSSVRRTAQALRLRPDLRPVQFRGNVETRLRKLAEGVAEATFLAVAGLKRLGLADKITSVVEIDEMLPAIAQGAIGVQVRSNDDRVSELVGGISHAASATAVACERAFLATLDGSCRTPIAGHATLSGGELRFGGETLTPDGKKVFAARISGAPADAERLGREAALDVKARGGSLIAS
ncbi:MAG: hydroxymethylbilane synthase [Proteobacteria bacterium]|nr:hydroxymethylbilane synthase [Pseudomonadota bacterium]